MVHKRPKGFFHFAIRLFLYTPVVRIIEMPLQQRIENNADSFERVQLPVVSLRLQAFHHWCAANFLRCVIRFVRKQPGPKTNFIRPIAKRIVWNYKSLHKLVRQTGGLCKGWKTLLQNSSWYNLLVWCNVRSALSLKIRFLGILVPISIAKFGLKHFLRII